MATEYRETIVAGTSYERAYNISIDYPDGGQPSVLMARERVFVLDDGKKIKERMSPLQINFDPLKEYLIFNPETGEPTGQTITQFEMFIHWYSIFVLESEAKRSRDLEAISKIEEYLLTLPEGERSVKKMELFELSGLQEYL